MINPLRMLLLLFTTAFMVSKKCDAHEVGFEATADPPIVEASACAGEPFGFGSILVKLGNVDKGAIPRVLVTEASGRVLYPCLVLEPLPHVHREVVANGPRIGRGALIERLRTAIQSGKDAVQPPMALRISFGFVGDRPLQLQLIGDVEQKLSINVQGSALSHSQAMQRWWTGYTQQAKQQLELSDYPPLIQTYLTGMLASKLGLPVPDLRSDKEKEKNLDEPLTSLSLLAGLESRKIEMLRENMLAEPCSRERKPLPSSPSWHDIPPPEVPANMPIEAIASRVPPECFYMRFGKFSNYLWFRDLAENFGGELNQFIMKRGFSYATNKRMETMLNTRSTLLAKLFGDSIIADMALIGRDLYLQDGPCLGVLFEAKNPELLLTALQQERTATAKRLSDQGVLLETVNIAGRSVSLLHAPDNSIRAFLVAQDQFVLITTSHYLAKRFLEVSEGQVSLANTPHFRFARLLLPEKNQYALFAYLSPEFFRGLLSPEYQIELRRRLKAMAYLEMAEMASWAAQSEGVPAASIESLIQEGYLPKNFHEREDDSRTLRQGDRWVDSLRGGRGSFLPVADVELLEVTPEESERYQRQSQFFQQDWKQTDPLVIGLRRFATPGRADCERLALEAYVAPFGSEKYGWLSTFLGPPIERQIQLPPDDAANIQIHMAGSDLRRKSTPDHVLFLGLKDLTPPRVGDNAGLIQTLRMLKETPAYLGAWPLPGTLDRLPLGMGGGPPDALGFSKLLIGLWRWQGSGFSVLSFNRSILESSIPHLATIPAEDPAQLRLRVGDLTSSHLAEWVNTRWYREAFEASWGNARLLDTVSQQLRLPEQDAKAVAERLLDCKLQCPLGGNWEIEGGNETNGSKDHGTRTGATGGMWYSTAWPVERKLEDLQAPPQYMAPWLSWFRGGQAHLTQLPDRLVLIAQLDLQKLPPNPEGRSDGDSSLPSLDFDIFKSPFSFLGGDTGEASKKKVEPPRRAF